MDKRIPHVYTSAIAVTPSDTVPISTKRTQAIWVGTAGALRVGFASAADAVTLSGCAAGQLIPIGVTFVKASGTAASGVIALYSS